MVSEELVKELMAEIEMLREENQRLKSSVCTYNSLCKRASLTTDYIVLKEEPFTIRGVLITEGVWNGDYYPARVLKEMVEKGDSIPIKVEHGGNPEFGDRQVGYLTNWEYNDILKGIIFDAVLTDEKAIQLVKEGKYPAVSLFSWVDRKEVNGYREILSAKPLEISLTDNPAVPYALIAFSKKHLKEDGTIIIKSEAMPMEEKQVEMEVTPVQEAKTEEAPKEASEEAPKESTQESVPEVKEIEIDEEIKAQLEQLGISEEEFKQNFVELEVKEGEDIVLDVLPVEEAAKKKRPRLGVRPRKYYYRYPYPYPKKQEETVEPEPLARKKKVILYYYGYPYGYPYYPYYYYAPPYYYYYYPYPYPPEEEKDKKKKLEERIEELSKAIEELKARIESIGKPREEEKAALSMTETREGEKAITAGEMIVKAFRRP